ncbi:hypothetical protein SLS63_003844 [Diaporthe eres]|uniref:Ankyrin repeat domain-containing protein n=1 Tax=Diaporthe eres TaxID=83184 RepID=A0ABR1PF70_DIAER
MADHPLMKQLDDAVANNSLDSVKEVFLNHGFDVNAPLDKGLALPPLGHMLTDVDMVRWLIAHGADPNAESHHGLTPFLKAVQVSPLATVRLLSEAGASLTIAVPFVCAAPAAQDGETEADGAARRLEVLRYLLDNGADPEAPMWAHNRYGRGNDFDYGTGLNRAIVKRAESLAEELLRRGARTDSKTLNIASRGETALELAGKYTPRLVPLVAERRKEEELTSGGVAP